MKKYSSIKTTLKTLFFSSCILAVWGCSSPSTAESLEELRKAYKTDISFSQDSVPKAFSAKKTDGTIFNSKEMKGKYWVILGYEKNYLKPEHKDVIDELNGNYEKYKDKISMIGILDGFSDDPKKINEMIRLANIKFPQIDNTKSFEKTRIINHDIYCWPIKIIINPEGKVIYAACGGGSEGLDAELEQLIANKKI